MSEKKDKIIKLENGKLLIKFKKSIDPNGDGEELASIALEVSVDLAEIPDEVIDAWKKKKDKK